MNNKMKLWIGIGAIAVAAYLLYQEKNKTKTAFSGEKKRLNKLKEKTFAKSFAGDKRKRKIPAVMKHHR